MKQKNIADRLYKGNEYLSLYPYIYYGYGKCSYLADNTNKDYYVKQTENGLDSVISLKEWLER